MTSALRRRSHLALIAASAVIATAAGARSAGGSASSGSAVRASGAVPTGGAPIGGLAPTRKRNRGKIPAPPSKRSHGRWLAGVTITEYWPAPERWFIGGSVKAPGLVGRHRIDWLYSATGVSMQGDGIGLDRRVYHINALGDGGWVTAAGAPTSPADGWAGGPPFWRAGGYWRNSVGGVTFPLARGGWSAGTGRRYIPLPGVTFAAGPSLPLRFYQSIAVDPSVIALGSRVYVPAYRHDRHGGWFIAQDTGGAITGLHVDVFRNPPPHAGTSGRYLTGRRVYVISPRRH